MALIHREVNGEVDMVYMFSRNWWVLVLRGIFAVLFGVLAIIWPSIALAVLVLLFGVYALVDGVLAIWTAFSSRKKTEKWWVALLEGVAGIAAGAVVLIWPGITAMILLFLIAGWAVITGIFEILAAIRLRKQIENEWFLVLSGLVSIVFGVAIGVWPRVGLLTLVWLIAIYAILFGVLIGILGFRLRSAGQKLEARAVGEL
jgi:uncharacterized membrane protein HdeD (DUF308 family)